jgi:hypothetical protein
MKASLDKTPARPLMAADLCDRCSSGAVVETVMTQGGSLLCAPSASHSSRTHSTGTAPPSWSMSAASSQSACDVAGSGLRLPGEAFR